MKKIEQTFVPQEFNGLAYLQLMVPPFRPETGIPPEMIPVYSALTPFVPPYSPYRPVGVYPLFSTLPQIRLLLTPANFWFHGSYPESYCIPIVGEPCTSNPY